MARLAAFFLVLAMGLTAPPAAAQLPLPGEPEEPPPSGERQPPPVTPAEAPGEGWVTEGADSTHRFWSQGGIDAPLELRWTAPLDGQAPRTVLISAGVVVVAAGSTNSVGSAKVIAFDAATGARRWQFDRPVDDVVIAGGRVVIEPFSGPLVGLDLQTGAQAWQLDVGFASTLTPSGDDVFFYASHPQDGWFMTAVDATSGRIRWRVKEDEFTQYGRLLVSGERIFHALDCATAAYDRRDGARLWENGAACSGGGQSTLGLAGTHVLTDRRVFDAGSGRALPVEPPPRDDNVIAGDTLITRGDGGVGAFELGTNQRRWSWKAGDSASGRAAAAASGDRVAVRHGGVVAVLDRGDGRELWKGAVRLADGTSLVAASGLVLIGDDEGKTLSALGPQTRAPKVAVRPKAPVVEFGKRVSLNATVHYDNKLYLAAPVTLLADGAPFRRLRPAALQTADVAGTTTFTTLPTRNTGYVLAAQGGRSRPVVVTIVPRIRLKVLRTTASGAAVRARVRVPKRARLRGRRIAVYVARVRARRFERLGSARLTGRRGRYAARLGVARTRLRGKDFIIVCVRNMRRHHLGFGDRLDRRCGAWRISVPKAKASAAARRSAPAMSAYRSRAARFFPPPAS